MEIGKLIAWNRAEATPIRLISVSEKGFNTPLSLFNKGMYICDCCGTINSVDRDKCKECLEEKFIVLEN